MGCKHSCHVSVRLSLDIKAPINGTVTLPVRTENHSDRRCADVTGQTTHTHTHTYMGL